MNGKMFSTTITPLGAERLANAALTGVPVNFAEMAVGDGGGTLPKADTSASGLIGEKYRGPLNRLVIADSDASVIEAEMIMPPQVGGFWLRELALYAEDGACIATSNMPETYKPLLAEGSGRFQVLRMQLKVSSTADVELIADPAVILATSEDVRKAESEAKDYADDLADKMEKMMKEAISQARRAAWEDDNPAGTVRFFAQHIDPNEKWPWSKWTYTGENKTIRVGKADGSDVGSEGGQDEITLTGEHLPTHKHRVKGKAKSFHFEQIETEDAGEHDHEFPLTGDASNTGMADGGDPAKQDGAQRTSKQPAHRHAVNIPDHEHEIDFDSESAGEGKSFSIVEAHTLLMCWARVA